MDISLFLIIFFISLVIVFVESAFKMGYGLLTPILLLFGFEFIIVLGTLLLSQIFVGLSKTIFHAINYKINYPKETQENVELPLILIIFGAIGSFLGFILVVFIPSLYIIYYIGFMIIVIGILTILNNYLFKLEYSDPFFFLISSVSGFNKVLSGAGYGHVITFRQLIKGEQYGKYEGISALSEAFVSGVGFYYTLSISDFPL